MHCLQGNNLAAYLKEMQKHSNLPERRKYEISVKNK
jgi:hypothetical protein